MLNKFSLSSPGLSNISVLKVTPKQENENKLHSVWFERDVRRIDFVVIFFQWTQNWTALNFEVNFQPLIQPYSSRLINNFCWGGWALLSVSKLERQRTSGTQKRSKSDFMYCRKVPNLIKEFLGPAPVSCNRCSLIKPGKGIFKKQFSRLRKKYLESLTKMVSSTKPISKTKTHYTIKTSTD